MESTKYTLSIIRTDKYEIFMHKDGDLGVTDLVSKERFHMCGDQAKTFYEKIDKVKINQHINELCAKHFSEQQL